ncbi:unnamed protein product [Orchesella dallaii]|uniref:C2H2-type domain-containing protein n=1 Tax=Orchesella dallaii TaxID=48710 RepID=A0ABP1Q7G1_9HEXA
MNHFQRDASRTPPSRSCREPQLIDLAGPCVNVQPDIEVVDLFIEPVRRNRSSIPPEVVVIDDEDSYGSVETPDHEVEEIGDEGDDVSYVESSDYQVDEIGDGDVDDDDDSFVETPEDRHPVGTVGHALAESRHACEVILNELQIRSEIDASFEARIKELEEENRQLRSDKDDALRVLDSTDVALQEYIELLEMLENKLDMMDQVEFRARAFDWRYREEMKAAFGARVKALEKDNQNLKTKKDELEQLLDSNVAELHESRRRVISLERKLEQVEEELAQTKEDLQDNEMGLEIAAEEKAELQRKLLDLEILSSDLEKLQIENTKLKTENAKLRKGLKADEVTDKGVKGKNSSPKANSTCVKKALDILRKSKSRGGDPSNHGLENRTIVKLYRCYCGERFTSKPSFYLHLKRYSGGATWRCKKKECGDTFYTEEHLKAHSCKAVVNIDEVGHPRTWKRARCSIPYIDFNEKRMDDKTYVKWKISQESSLG